VFSTLFAALLIVGVVVDGVVIEAFFVNSRETILNAFFSGSLALFIACE
jgi:hypothetical protein